MWTLRLEKTFATFSVLWLLCAISKKVDNRAGREMEISTGAGSVVVHFDETDVHHREHE